METSGDPVEAALDERRAQRTQQRRLANAATLADRCHDAAERTLWVRVFLLGGTTMAGDAIAVTDRLLTLDRTNINGSGARAHIDLGALVRVTVADPGVWQRTTPEPGPHASPVIHLVAELARRGGDVKVTTADGSSVCGALFSLGDRALGLASGHRRGETREGPGAFDDRVDWVDPTHIVAAAEAG